MPTKAQSGRCDGPVFVGGHNEEVQGNRISFDASRRIIGNKSIGVQGFGTVCTSKKSPTTKSNRSNKLYHTAASESNTGDSIYERATIFKANVYFFVSNFFFVFVWYI